MGNSVEYRNGVFVATGPATVDGIDLSGGTATGTALIVRPTGQLAPVDASGPLVGAEFPLAGPTLCSASTAPAAGGTRRIAVATIIASLIATMAFGSAMFGAGFGGQCTSTSVPTSSSARGAFGAAAAVSTSATSVAFTVSATQTTSSTAATLIDGSGAVDLTTNTAKLRATVPALSGLVGRGNNTVNVVSDGSTVYLGSSALSSLTGGSTWLKAALPKDSSNADSSMLAVLANPAQLLGLLSSVGGKVTTVDNVNLHGTPNTEYSTTATLAHLTSRAGLTAGSKLGSHVSQILQQPGNTSVPITVAFGFSHYNAPVTVTTPPASQTTDITEVVHSVQGVVSGIRHTVSSFASKF